MLNLATQLVAILIIIQSFLFLILFFTSNNSYLIVDDKPTHEGRDDGDNVGQEVSDAHQTRTEVGSQVDVNQLEDKTYKY